MKDNGKNLRFGLFWIMMTMIDLDLDQVDEQRCCRSRRCFLLLFYSLNINKSNFFIWNGKHIAISYLGTQVYNLINF